MASDGGANVFPENDNHSEVEFSSDESHHGGDTNDPTGQIKSDDYGLTREPHELSIRYRGDIAM